MEMNYKHGLRRLVISINIIMILVLLVPSDCAAQVFDFNANCQQAYDEIMHLKLNSGQLMIDAEKKKNPKNIIPYFLENYIDFFVLFFNEDAGEYEKRKKNLSKRIDLINKGPQNSPFYLFTKSVMHFQWAAVRIKFGYNWDAGWEFRRSFLQVKENMKLFPSFAPNLLYNGAMQVAAGTIPDGYKWLSNLLGIKGSIKNGMQALEQFLNSNDSWAKLFHAEAVFYFLYLKFYVQNEKEAVFEFISNSKLNVKTNHLFAYMATNLSINSQRSENALRIMSQKDISPAYMNTPVWDLEMGYAKLNHLEPDANIYFEKFIQDFKGKFYLKDALQKLSWYYYLQDDQQKASYYRNEILKKGSVDAEADKQAQQEANSKRWPNKLLLQARLLNDGGYYREALRLLYGKSINDFSTVEDKLEFAYRVGRLYDDVGKEDEAIVFYKQAITIGEKRSEHYAARAAVQIGYIYEQRGDKQTAVTWFKRCLNMEDHEFKNSLDQKAKAGIERCKE